MGARAFDGAAGSRGARRDARHRLHHDAEADADHGGKGPGQTQRNRAHPRLFCDRRRGANATAARAGPRRSRVRRIGGGAGAPRAERGRHIRIGAARNSQADRRLPGETVMTGTMKDTLTWTLIHFLWQGGALGLASFILLRVVLPERATTRYAIGVGTLAAMLLSAVA